MKLPGYQRTGVESLGRESIHGPAQLWRAEYERDQERDKMFLKVGLSLSDLMSAQDETDSLQLLQERIIQDKANNQSMEEYLVNTPVVDVEDTDVPEHLRNYLIDWIDANANPETDDLSRVDTHKFMDHYMQQYYTETTNASLGVLSQYGLGEDYIKSMDTQITDGIGNIMQAKVKQHQDHIKAKADVHYNNALNAGDELTARQIAADNLESGSWHPDQYAEEMMRIGPAMDNMQAQKMLATATGQGDLDHAVEFVENSRMTLDDKTKFYGETNARLNGIETRYNRLVDRNQKRYYSDGVSMLVDGTLTMDWIEANAANDNLSGGNAMALRNALLSGSPMASDPAIVDAFKGRIAQMRYYKSTEIPIDLAFEMLQDDMTKAYTGLGATGFGDKSLTGEDYAELMGLVEDSRNTALGKGGQQYSQANKIIRSLTGYTDMLSSFEGSSPQRMAYTKFVSDLDNWMQFNPNANAQDWVLQNAHRYDPGKFQAEYGTRLQTLYPRYSHHFIDGVIKADEAYADALEDFQNGDMPESKFKALENDLQYKLLQIGADPVDENAIRRESR